MSFHRARAEFRIALLFVSGGLAERYRSQATAGGSFRYRGRLARNVPSSDRVSRRAASRGIRIIRGSRATQDSAQSAPFAAAWIFRRRLIFDSICSKSWIASRPLWLNSTRLSSICPPTSAERRQWPPDWR